MEPESQVANSFQPEIIKQAQLAVCARSDSVDDARVLLDMLGLVEDTERFPVAEVTLSGSRTRPIRRPCATLPVSGYGAVVPYPPD